MTEDERRFREWLKEFKKPNYLKATSSCKLRSPVLADHLDKTILEEAAINKLSDRQLYELYVKHKLGNPRTAANLMDAENGE